MSSPAAQVLLCFACIGSVRMLLYDGVLSLRNGTTSLLPALLSLRNAIKALLPLPRQFRALMCSAGHIVQVIQKSPLQGPMTVFWLHQLFALLCLAISLQTLLQVRQVCHLLNVCGVFATGNFVGQTRVDSLVTGTCWMAAARHRPSTSFRAREALLSKQAASVA